MRVLVDTNVVLDALLRRSKPGVLELAVSAITVANLFYIGRKLVGAAQARQDVRTCLAAFEILPIDRGVLIGADALPGKDFEDNLQIAAAVAAGLDMIITRNVGHFDASPVRVGTPAELLTMLSV
jgi:predicted nucleic acid-binding protein